MEKGEVFDFVLTGGKSGRGGGWGSVHTFVWSRSCKLGHVGLSVRVGLKLNPLCLGTCFPIYSTDAVTTTGSVLRHWLSGLSHVVRTTIPRVGGNGDGSTYFYRNYSTPFHPKKKL